MSDRQGEVRQEGKKRVRCGGRQEAHAIVGMLKNIQATRWLPDGKGKTVE